MASSIFGIVFSIAVAVALVGGYFVYTTRRIARGAERSVPPGGDFIEVNGRKVHYVERGEGLPILMLHGLGGTLHHLLRPLMEQFGDGYRLIAIDRPGSGYSPRARSEEGRITQQAAFVADFIDAMGLERPLLVGHSLGGAIALATALEHGDKVSGLALIAPMTRYEPEPPAEFRGLYIGLPFSRALIAHTVAIPMSVKNAPQTIDFVFGPQKPPRDYAVAGGALAGLRPSHFYATSTDAVAVGRDMPQLERRYGELDIPVGILFGTADRVLDHRRHGVGLVDEIGSLDLELMEGVGHMPQYADTERVVSFIRRIAHRAFAGRY